MPPPTLLSSTLARYAAVREVLSDACSMHGEASRARCQGCTVTHPLAASVSIATARKEEDRTITETVYFDACSWGMRHVVATRCAERLREEEKACRSRPQLSPVRLTTSSHARKALPSQGGRPQTRGLPTCFHALPQIGAPAHFHVLRARTDPIGLEQGSLQPRRGGIALHTTTRARSRTQCSGSGPWCGVRLS